MDVVSKLEILNCNMVVNINGIEMLINYNYEIGKLPVNINLSGNIPLSVPVVGGLEGSSYNISNTSLNMLLYTNTRLFNITLNNSVDLTNLSTYLIACENTLFQILSNLESELPIV